MRRCLVAWATVMICAGMATPAAMAATAPCKLSLLATLDVRISNGGSVVVPARLNEQDVWFLLATNNASPFIFQPAVARLGLKPRRIIEQNETGSRTRHPETGITSGDQAVDLLVALQPFTIGRVSFGGWQAAVIPDAGDSLQELEGKPIVGILGTQLFKLVDVELDLANDTVRLFRVNECKEPPVYWGGEFTTAKLKLDYNGAMHFIMELDGQNIDTGLLNGSRTASLDEAIARTYFGFDRQSPGIVHDPGGQTGDSYYAMSLTAAGLNMRNSRVRIRDASDKCGVSRSGGKEGSIQYADCYGSPPFSLGTTMVEKLRIYIAARQEKIYITRGAVADPASSDKADATTR